MTDSESDYWRHYFAELALAVEQTSACLWSGKHDEARERLATVREKVDEGKTRLQANASEKPRFNTAVPELTPLNTQVLRATGLMIELLNARNSETRRTALDLLTMWLPRLRREDANLLSSYHRSFLYKWLVMDYAPERSDWIILVARTLTRIQDLGALPHLRRLAASAAVTRAGKRVKAAAEACRVELELIHAREMLNDTLLRASGHPADELLRTVESPGISDSESLLRPGDH